MRKNESGFIPLIVLVIIAAVSLIVGTTVLKKPLAQMVAQVTQNTLFSPKPQIQTIINTPTYTTIGTATSATILVKFRTSVSPQTISAIHQQLGTHVERVIEGINTQIVNVPSTSSVSDILQQFKGRSEVEYAEPNFVAKKSMIPNDPYYSSEWNLQKIDAPKAWDSTQGGYGPIAVVDTGIMSNHSDLSGEVLSGYNFISNTTDTTDDNGHGTHVAGIIAAETNNGNGVASIGFKGSLLPVKVLDSTGTGTYGDVASGITYAVDHGAKIINLSLGGSSQSQTLQDAVTYAVQHGAYVVAAAGNNGNNSPEYPAACSGALAVSATDSNDNLASFSSYGSDIFVSAPGVNITSTYNNGGYAVMSGTSMAAPELSGLLGLAMSYQSSKNQNLLTDVEQTSDKVGSYPYDSNGWNQYFGYGRIDAGKLLTLIAGTPTPTATSTPTQNGIPTQTSPKNVSFNVDIEGNIDSIDTIHGILVVKVRSISQNIGVTLGNLADIYLTSNTVITTNNQYMPFASLTSGENVNIKALWQNTILTATTIIAQGSVQQNTTNQNNQNPNTSNTHQPSNPSGQSGISNTNSSVSLPSNASQNAANTINNPGLIHNGK